mgnify:CR=1 FL=1
MVPADIDNRLAGVATIRRMMLSAQYFAENWEISSELIREIQDSEGLFAQDFEDRRRGEGGFVQVRYLFNNQLSGLIGYDTYVNDVLNVGNDNELTILELAQKVINITESKSEIIHLPALKEGDMKRRCPDITKMQAIFGKAMSYNGGEYGEGILSKYSFLNTKNYYIFELCYLHLT